MTAQPATVSAPSAPAPAARPELAAMLGAILPSYALPALVSGEYGKEYVTLGDDFGQGQWRVFLHWPSASLLDCPRELTAFARHLDEFFLLKTLLIGVAGDTHSLLHSLRGNGRHATTLPYPIIQDRHQAWTQALQLSSADASSIAPATIIVDPQDRIRLIQHHERSHCRSVDAVLTELAALQTQDLDAAAGELVGAGTSPRESSAA